MSGFAWRCRRCGPSVQPPGSIDLMRRFNSSFFSSSEAERRMWPECRAWLNETRRKTHSEQCLEETWNAFAALVIASPWFFFLAARPTGPRLNAAAFLVNVFLLLLLVLFFPSPSAPSFHHWSNALATVGCDSEGGTGMDLGFRFIAARDRHR